MKVAIIGSRNFNDNVIFNYIVNSIFLKIGFPKKIISGGARGADSFAKEFALENNYEFAEFLPDFLNFPPGTRNFEAPHARNSKIAESCDYIIAFWDMKSSGTKDTIDKSISMGKKIYVYDFVNKFIYNIEDI
jgi:predicted Rossmann fold nucleotide-binding protein DprA/Smf involved in DNA uptake